LERALGSALMPQLTQPGMTVGEAMLNAQRTVAVNNANMAEVVLGWMLPGDPAAQTVQWRTRAPWRHISYTCCSVATAWLRGPVSVMAPPPTCGMLALYLQMFRVTSEPFCLHDRSD